MCPDQLNAYTQVAQTHCCFCFLIWELKGPRGWQKPFPKASKEPALACFAEQATKPGSPGLGAGFSPSRTKPKLRRVPAAWMGAVLGEGSPTPPPTHLSASSTCCRLKSSDGTILSMCCGSQMLACSSSFTVFLTTPCRPLMPDIRILYGKRRRRLHTPSEHLYSRERSTVQDLGTQLLTKAPPHGL